LSHSCPIPPYEHSFARCLLSNFLLPYPGRFDVFNENHCMLIVQMCIIFFVIVSAHFIAENSDVALERQSFGLTHVLGGQSRHFLYFHSWSYFYDQQHQTKTHPLNVFWWSELFRTASNYKMKKICTVGESIILVSATSKWFGSR